MSCLVLSSSCHKWMSKGCLWFHPSFRIPDETLRYEVDEIFVIGLQDLLQRFRSRAPSAALGIDNNTRSTIRF